jgi:hypothetical protein
MAQRRLGRTGYESKRNLAKAYRPPRLVIKHTGEEVFHELDMMRLGVDGRQVNTTGCFGEVSTWGLGFVNKKYNNAGYPGREKRPKRKKNVCKIYIKPNIAIDFTNKSFDQLNSLRAALMTGMLLMEFAGNKIGPGTKLIFETLTNYIQQVFPEHIPRMHQADEQRRACTLGMYRNGAHYEPIKSQSTRVKRALRNMAIFNVRPTNSAIQ